MFFSGVCGESAAKAHDL
ncbi:hypothetical protein Golax_011653 [Gossypium laxum]|uniref:Uncharacterized protein n=1 Tax=Gossypium laxum TaxID=34288 RepID=A0A7J8ZL71_9ROSI|nr:hypothetical protein [Gossypium laxum]